MAFVTAGQGLAAGFSVRMTAAVDKAPPRPGVDRVWVKQAKASGTTTGGLLLAGSVKQKVDHGVVVAKGPGKILRDGSTESHEDVAVGDTVLFDELANWRVDWEGEKYVVVRYRNICCKW